MTKANIAKRIAKVGYEKKRFSLARIFLFFFAQPVIFGCMLVEYDVSGYAGNRSFAYRMVRFRDSFEVAPKKQWENTISRKDLGNGGRSSQMV